MPWIRIVAFRTGIIAAAFCLGCGVLATEPEIRWELRPGTLEFHDEPIAIDLPQVAAVGLTAVITVRTFGGGCTQQGPTEVEVAGLTAIVQPMDSAIVPFPDLACTSELRFFEHRAELKFDHAGVATVRVLGRREPGGGPVELERTLVVQ